MPVALFGHSVTKVGGKVSTGHYFEHPNRGVSSGRDRTKILQFDQRLTLIVTIKRSRVVAGSVKYCRVADGHEGRRSVIIKSLDL